VYRWIEHTAEIELEIEDDSPEAVFTEALVAFGELLTEHRGGEPVSHAVELSAADHAALLADWLNELVYLADTDGFVPERVEALTLSVGKLDARIGGQRGVPRNPVKAVTYHDLELREIDGVWRARLVLDV
jgi:SHS2 domain-containing protein